MSNIFRQAKQLLDKKDIGLGLTEEERELVAAAMIPFNIRDCPLPDNITIAEGLEELAKIVEEAHERAG